MGRVQFFTWLMGLIPFPHEIYVKKITFLTFRFHFCSFLYLTFHSRKEKELLISVAGKNNLRFITCEEPITVIEQSFQQTSLHYRSWCLPAPTPLRGWSVRPRGGLTAAIFHTHFSSQLSKLQLFLNKLYKCHFTTLKTNKPPLNETNHFQRCIFCTSFPILFPEVTLILMQRNNGQRWRLPRTVLTTYWLEKCCS